MRIIVFALCLGLVAASWKSSWHPVKIDPEVEAPDIQDEEWSYPLYVLKTDTAFINLADSVITAIDTVHIPHNAICEISLGTDTAGNDTIEWGFFNEASLPFARANMLKDSLSIVVYGKGSSYLEEVQIAVIGHLCEVQYNTYESDSTGSYTKSSEQFFDRVSLTLNKRNPVPGDLLIGAFQFDGRLEQPEKSYLKIEGRFAVVVE